VKARPFFRSSVIVTPDITRSTLRVSSAGNTPAHSIGSQRTRTPMLLAERVAQVNVEALELVVVHELEGGVGGVGRDHQLAALPDRVERALRPRAGRERQE
jgi:hypothetical protein